MAQFLDLKVSPIAVSAPPIEKGTIICNPPYGARIGDEDNLKDVYRDLGFTLKNRFQGWDAWIMSGNKDLLKEVESKNFRLDLYHRLSVIIIHVPSLNERKSDIPLLTEHFLQQVADDYGQVKKAIDKKAVDALEKHNWTGNIREFRNVIERLVILSGKTISEEDVFNFVIPRV